MNAKQRKKQKRTRANRLNQQHKALAYRVSELEEKVKTQQHAIRVLIQCLERLQRGVILILKDRVETLEAEIKQPPKTALWMWIKRILSTKGEP